jgi:hypothetical protein
VNVEYRLVRVTKGGVVQYWCYPPKGQLRTGWKAATLGGGRQAHVLRTLMEARELAQDVEVSHQDWYETHPEDRENHVPVMIAPDLSGEGWLKPERTSP